MDKGQLEIRKINWKPLVFMSIVLASKFWEDINYWNCDYIPLVPYTLERVN